MSSSQSSTPAHTTSPGGEGYTLAIIGCGTMGIAILSGMLDSKRANEAKRAASAALSRPTSSNGINNDLSASIASLLDVDDAGIDGDSSSSNSLQLPSRFIACVSRNESAKRLRLTFEEYKDQVQVLASDNLTAAKTADVIILACKPQMVKDILAEEGLKEALRGKLVCSICAGLTIKSIRQCLHEDSMVVRAMPNTPAKVRTTHPSLVRLPCSQLTYPAPPPTDPGRHDNPHASSPQRQSIHSIPQSSHHHLFRRRKVQGAG